jgi:23S rRNA (cytidine1920-2'-O)/16S rRNA (cytidine1409-2'-O)-methyltransferase
VSPGEPIVLLGEPARFVSRGGDKLDGALDAFGLDITGWHALDAGASTGGFTDCLLQRGAATVHAVDVGYGQLDARLRAHPRVVVRERTNVRELIVEEFADHSGVFRPFDLVTADLSFISLTLVAQSLVGVVRRDGALVLLVKPQFEVGHAEASKGRGVIRDPELWRSSLEEVASAFEQAGTGIMGAVRSPLLGPAGNAEFFLCARVGADSPCDAERSRQIDDAVRAAGELVGS